MSDNTVIDSLKSLVYCGERDWDLTWEQEQSVKSMIELLEKCDLDRLRELATADAKGRVVIMPDCNLCERRSEKNGIAETVCDICIGNEFHNKASNHFKPDRALSKASAGEKEVAHE